MNIAILDLTYTAFKQVAVNNNLPIYYVTTQVSGAYDLFCCNNRYNLHTAVNKPSDVTDFMSNVMPSASVAYVYDDAVALATQATIPLLATRSPSGVPIYQPRMLQLPLTNGTATALNVNGATTNQVFTVAADPLKDMRVQFITFVLSSTSIPFLGGYFAAGTALTNGLLVECVLNGNAYTIATIKRNEDFAGFNSFFDYERQAGLLGLGGADLMTIKIEVNQPLIAGSTDLLRVTVRDNISASGIYFFQAYMTGYKNP